MIRIKVIQISQIQVHPASTSTTRVAVAPNLSVSGFFVASVAVTSTTTI